MNNYQLTISLRYSAKGYSIYRGEYYNNVMIHYDNLTDIRPIFGEHAAELCLRRVIENISPKLFRLLKVNSSKSPFLRYQYIYDFLDISDDHILNLIKV